MGDSKRDADWLERELAEVRARESAYRQRIMEREAEAARLQTHAQTIHHLLRSRPPSKDSLDATLENIARASSNALGIERTSIWYIDPARLVLRCALLVHRGEVVSGSSAEIACSSCPSYIASLHEGQAVAVDNAYDDPRTQELVPYLRERNIGALLDIPILIGAQLIGVVCHEHVGAPRSWAPAEIYFAANVGAQVALALETERRIHAEYTARGTEAKYQQLVESLPVTVYAFDARTGHLEYLSPSAAQLSTRSPAQWIRGGVRDWIERIHEDDRAPIYARFKQGTTGGFPEEVTYRLRTEAGDQRWIRDTCHVVRDVTGQPVAIQGVLADVTPHVQAERARREAERRYRALLEHADIIAVALDTRGRVTFANDAFVRASGQAREALLGFDWFDAVLPVATRAAIRDRFLLDMTRDTVAPRFEITIVSRSGQQRQLLTTNTVLRDAEGAVEGTLSLALDVTDRRTLESALLHHTKLESLGRLAAGVAHDFNNLLTVMMGEVTTLRTSSLGSDPSLSASVDALDRAVEHASALARSLLLYGRKEAVHADVFTLDSVVNEARPLLEAMVGKRLQLRVVLDAPETRISSERSRTRQVLLNLVGNAADAVQGQGTIQIATHRELLEDDVARARGAARGGEFAVLTVSDDGQGMDAHTLAHVFDPFFTTKTDGRGTGLGLAITESVAHQSGGFVRVHSELGRGTTFRVWFPAATRTVATSVVPSSAVPTGQPVSDSKTHATILVVEDVGPIREMIASTLTEAGYEVLAVGTCRAATEVLGSVALDVLLTDMQLPDGSGDVLAQSARRARPRLRVILMSGALEDSEAFDATLAKPFDAPALLAATRRALHLA